MKTRLIVYAVAACLLTPGGRIFAEMAEKKPEAKAITAPEAAVDDPGLSNFEIMQLANDADPDKGKRTAFALYLLSASFGEKVDRDGCETKENVKASCATIENSTDRSCKIEITSTCATQGIFSSEWIAFRIKKLDSEDGAEWGTDAKSGVRGGS